MWHSMYCYALEWNFMKKYWSFKVHLLFVRKMWYSMHLHEFSWKNFCLSKFTFFLVQMWYFMYWHEYTWKKIDLSKFNFFLVQMWESMHFHGKILNFQRLLFSLFVRCYIPCTCTNYHEKILIFQSCSELCIVVYQGYMPDDDWLD